MIREAADRGEKVIGTRAFFNLVIEGQRSYRCHYPALVLGPVFPNGDVIGCSHGRPIGNVRRSPVREVLADQRFQENAAAGPDCTHGCRDWGLHDLSAVYERRFELGDARRYFQTFAG